MNKQLLIQEVLKKEVKLFKHEKFEQKNISNIISDLYETLYNKNKITLQAYIDSGSYGIVFKSMDDLKNKQIAVKIMLTPDQQSHELEILNRLKNTKNCLKKKRDILHTIQNITFIIFTTKLCKQNLENLIQSYNQKEIPIEKQMDIIKQCLYGLYELHRLYPKIIHGDLKPENILIDFKDNIKLADFGLSIEIKDHEKKEQNGGTFNYYAPEKLKNEKINEKSDIYSMGFIFMRIHNPKLTNISHFLDNLGNINKSQLNESNQQGDKLKIIQLIQNMNKQDPNERYSARDCLNFLEIKFEDDSQDQSKAIKLLQSQNQLLNQEKDQLKIDVQKQQQLEKQINDQNIHKNKMIKEKQNLQQKIQQIDLDKQQLEQQIKQIDQEKQQLQQNIQSQDIEKNNLEKEKQELEKQLKQKDQELLKKKQEQQMEYQRNNVLDNDQKDQLNKYRIIIIFKFVAFLILLVISVENEIEEEKDEGNIAVIVTSIIEIVISIFTYFSYFHVKYTNQHDYEDFNGLMKLYFFISLGIQFILAYFSNLKDRKGQNIYIYCITVLQIFIHSPIFRNDAFIHKSKIINDGKAKIFYPLFDIIGVFSEIHGICSLFLIPKMNDISIIDETNKTYLQEDNNIPCQGMKNCLIASAVFYCSCRGFILLLQLVDKIDNKFFESFQVFHRLGNQIFIILCLCYYQTTSNWQLAYSLTFYILSSIIQSLMSIYYVYEHSSHFPQLDSQSNPNDKPTNKIFEYNIAILINSIFNQQCGSCLIILYVRYNEYNDWIQDFGIYFGLTINLVSLIQIISVNFYENFCDKLFISIFSTFTNFTFFVCMIVLAVYSKETYENVLAFNIVMIILQFFKFCISLPFMFNDQ